jgi:two-component system chemotaxis response regulator CheB
MTVNLALVSENSFLRLAIDAILRNGDCRIEPVGSVGALSSVIAQHDIDLVLFDTALLGSTQPHAAFLGITPPILAIDTGRSPLGLVASGRFAAVLRACDEGRLDIAALQRELPGAIAENLPGLASPQHRIIESLPRAHPLEPRDVLLVGASTGGPEALIALLTAMGPPLLPVVVAIHMPADQTATFAAHLSQRIGLQVVEAVRGELPPTGSIAVLKGGANYRIGRGATGITLRPSLADAGPYRPSINMLFSSAADAGLVCDAVVLSGMGEDGADGAARIEAAGGRVLVQRPDCCVVAGMPAATLAVCRAAQALAPASIAAMLTRRAVSAAETRPASDGT